MESSSQAGMIQLSSSTKRLVEIQDPTLQVQLRGEANIKGKGQMMTYWLRPPGHLVLLNWMSTLIGKPDVNMEVLKSLPVIFIEQAGSELELDKVLKMRGRPIMGISEEVLLREESVTLQHILSLSPTFLDAVSSADELRMVLKWHAKHPRAEAEFIDIIEEVLKEEGGSVGLRDVEKIPMPFLSLCISREQFDALLGICSDGRCDAFLGFAECLLEKNDPEGVGLDTILEMSATLGPCCSTESQVKQILGLIVDQWHGVAFLSSIVDKCGGGAGPGEGEAGLGSGGVVTRRESPSSVMESSLLDSQPGKEVVALFHSLPPSILMLVESEEQLEKLIGLGLRQPRPAADEAASETSVLTCVARAITDHDYSLGEILDHPTAILRSCQGMADMKAVLSWPPRADFVSFIASLLSEGEGEAEGDVRHGKGVWFGWCSGDERFRFMSASGNRNPRLTSAPVASPFRFAKSCRF
mmetsp:Transcript_11003/g.27812  ORF Transcript_11003/g.27812 Transcript_11003/m.27812 type:complete len:470 (+) Transcript_11003:3-1412(+)